MPRPARHQWTYYDLEQKGYSPLIKSAQREGEEVHFMGHRGGRFSSEGGGQRSVTSDSV